MWLQNECALKRETSSRSEACSRCIGDGGSPKEETSCRSEAWSFCMSAHADVGVEECQWKKSCEREV